MEKVRLGEVCEILNGYAFKSNLYEEDGTRIIRITNVQKGYIEDTDPKFYNLDKRPELSKYKLYEKDLLISLTGNVGRVGMLEKKMLPAALNQRVGCIRILNKSRLHKNYLFNALNNNLFEKECIKNSKGIAQKNLSTEWLKEYKIKLPSLEEQIVIANKLDKVQEIIDIRKKQIQELEELIKSKFIEMFGELKTSKKILLKDISEFVTVGIANSATQAYTDSGIIMFRNQNIKENYLDTSDLIYIKPEFADKYKSKELKENDILVTRTGYPGIACLVPKQYEACQTFTTLIVRLKDTKDINPSYICNFINSCFGKEYVAENKVGVAQQNFGAKALEKMPILLPPIEEQNLFEKLIERINQQKFKIQKNLKEMEKLQESLINRYFG